MMILLAAVLHIGPWAGKNLPAASPSAVKYRLTVDGKPHETVALRAQGLPRGWVASFCTGTFCAPFHYDATLDDNGHAAIELALIRTDDHAGKHVRITIIAPDSSPLTVESR